MPYRLGSVLIILVALLLRAHRASELGTQSDEGVHVVVAERLAEGDVLYRDLFENRTPGVEVILAAAFSLTKPNVLLARFLTMGAISITMAALVLSGKLSCELVWPADGRRPRLASAAGWAAGLLFGLAPLAVFWSRFTMLEHWQTAFSALAIACALLAVTDGRVLSWLASGILAGMAVLAKQSGVVVAGVLLLYLLILTVQAVKIHSRKALAYWLSGLFIPLVLFLLWMLVQGALDDFFHMLAGAGQLSPMVGLVEKADSLITWAARRPLSVLGVVGGLAIVTRRSFAASLPLMWAVAEVLAILAPAELDLGWGGFSHYTLPALASLAVLGGLGFAQLVLWARGSLLQKSLAAGLTALLLTATVGLAQDLFLATTEIDYPQASFVEERRVGKALASVADQAAPILVLGNASYYHWAARRPANRFFHLPEYLPESRLWPEAESDLLNTLTGQDVEAVLVSRLHLEERLSDAVRLALQEFWLPVAIFSYPYQRDVILYLPRPTSVTDHETALLSFDAGISLMAVELRSAGDMSLLVGLRWMAAKEPEKDWTAFVHVLDPEGRMLAQHDGVPVIGFRPTSSWTSGESVEDWHWIDLPSPNVPEGAQLAIGLYDPATGERSIMLNGSAGTDSFIMSLSEAAH